jgi:hypothetical protein
VKIVVFNLTSRISDLSVAAFAAQNFPTADASRAAGIRDAVKESAAGRCE